MLEAARSLEVLNNPDKVKLLSNILKTNVAICSSVGGPYIQQLGRIFMDLLNLYKAVSEMISESISQQGLIATKTPRLRGWRTIKKEILKLVETFINKAEDLDAVNRSIVPALLDAVLSDYNRNIEPARDAEVLHLITTITTRLGVSSLC